MLKKRLPKSVRKFIRFEKAKIRRQFFSQKEREKLIGELYQKFAPRPKESKSATIEIPREQVKAKAKA